MKDTRDTLTLLENLEWKEGWFLVTCDMNSLYRIIKHTKGRKTLEETQVDQTKAGFLKITPFGFGGPSIDKYVDELWVVNLHHPM